MLRTDVAPPELALRIIELQLIVLELAAPVCVVLSLLALVGALRLALVASMSVRSTDRAGSE